MLSQKSQNDFWDSTSLFSLHKKITMQIFAQTFFASLFISEEYDRSVMVRNIFTDFELF
ncbi:hypothetical protein [Peribacillus simplex]|uniref:hypothetical protein n=1 Tax=Peribacillus simplex TaxID=1478 RepID=UPI000B0754A7|nr:hypothetical protein [Peribacillus simplex]